MKDEEVEEENGDAEENGADEEEEAEDTYGPETRSTDSC